MSRLIKQNLFRQWFSSEPNTKQGQVELFRGKQFSENCWIQDNAADVPLICLCCPSVIANYDYTGSPNFVSRPQISVTQLPGRMNRDSPFITLIVVLRYAFFQANSSFLDLQQVLHRPVVVVLCFGRCSYGCPWQPWLQQNRPRKPKTL